MNIFEFILILIAMIIIFFLSLAYIAGKFGLFDKEDNNDK